jgi:ABC-type polysaccharide/polyol phosphate export permease
MFRVDKRKNHFRSFLGLAELIYHNTVRHVRKGSRNAITGLFANVMQTLIFVAAFYVMMEVLGLRGNAVRGNFVIYLLTGIFLFLTHNKAMGAVMGAEGSASAMMQHAPMNTAISIASAALSTLYIQVLSATIVIFIVHVTWEPVVLYKPAQTVGMFLLAWGSGIAVGLVFLSIKPWLPGFVAIASTIYSRSNMLTSGKMFVANTMPGYILQFFDWNPLFHCIDQSRGYAFINYNPHFSSLSYPLIVTIVFLTVGLMGEFYTRQYVSRSWSAGR